MKKVFLLCDSTWLDEGVRVVGIFSSYESAYQSLKNHCIRDDDPKLVSEGNFFGSGNPVKWFRLVTNWEGGTIQEEWGIAEFPIED